MSIIRSSNYEHIFWAPKGAKLEDRKVSDRDGWYFWDEVGLIGAGPMDTEDEAYQSLQSYVKEVLGVEPGSTIKQEVDLEPGDTPTDQRFTGILP